MEQKKQIGLAAGIEVEPWPICAKLSGIQERAMEAEIDTLFKLPDSVLFRVFFEFGGVS